MNYHLEVLQCMVHLWFACPGQPLSNANGWCLQWLVQGFELTLDLESPLAKLDKEQTGILNYQQFKALMTI